MEVIKKREKIEDKIGREGKNGEKIGKGRKEAMGGGESKKRVGGMKKKKRKRRENRRKGGEL